MTLAELLLVAAHDEPATYLILADHLEERGYSQDAEALRGWWLAPPALRSCLLARWDGGYDNQLRAGGDGDGNWGEYGSDLLPGGHGGRNWCSFGGDGGPGGSGQPLPRPYIDYYLSKP